MLVVVTDLLAESDVSEYALFGAAINREVYFEGIEAGIIFSRN